LIRLKNYSFLDYQLVRLGLEEIKTKINGFRNRKEEEGGVG